MRDPSPTWQSPPVSEVQQAHRRFQAAVGELTDAEAAAPSRLPGWTRAHVIGHVADNARAFARLTEHALQGERVELYPGGQAQRDSDIESLSRLPAVKLSAYLDEQVNRLETAWSTVEPGQWDLPVSFRNRELGFTVFTRWREVWIHLVDCDLGVTRHDWPVELASHVIDFLLERVPPGTVLTATDIGREWTTSGATVARISAEVRDLAAWIAGRAGDDAVSGPTVALGDWPAHPRPDR